ncbi:MAG: STAS domain-containing protein [Planctomycetota bacterium]|nr:STAS domain-containing protein [Planctomycetota bacterium]
MECIKQGNVMVVRLSGKDLANPVTTCQVFEDLIVTDGERYLVADLSQVDMVTSLQIGTIVSLHLIAYENVAVMKLAGVNERVKYLLRLIGLDKLMEMHHGTDVAVASFGGSPRQSGDRGKPKG